MQVPGSYTQSRELQGHTRDSLLARYKNSQPGATVESNEHAEAAKLIDDTLSLERSTRDLIGEDCRFIERDEPGSLVVVAPKNQNGEWGKESASLNYDSQTKQTTSFVDSLATGDKNVVMGHRFEDGNEVFTKTVTSKDGFQESKVICPTSGKPLVFSESFVSTQEPQLRPNASGGGLAMF